MKGLDFFATWFVELENSWLTFFGGDKRFDAWRLIEVLSLHDLRNSSLRHDETWANAASSCEIRKKFGRLTSNHVYMRVFFNKMIPMNILCSSGFLTNSFMMKVHKILNLFLFTWVAFFCWCFSENCGKNLYLPVLQKSRFVSPLFYYHNGCTRDSWKFQTGSCNLWNVSETADTIEKWPKSV